MLSSLRTEIKLESVLSFLHTFDIFLIEIYGPIIRSLFLDAVKLSIAIKLCSMITIFLQSQVRKLIEKINWKRDIFFN